MARLEASFTEKFISQYLLENFPKHDVNFIKEKRRRPQYQDFLTRAQVELMTDGAVVGKNSGDEISEDLDSETP